MENIITLLSNNSWLFVVMGFAVFVITDIIKILFVDRFSKKIMTKEKEKVAHTIKILIPLSLSTTICYFVSKYFPQYCSFSPDTVVGICGEATLFYRLFGLQKFFGLSKDTKNIITKEQAETAVKTVTNVTEDKKIDNKDIKHAITAIDELKKSFKNEKK